LILRKAWTHVTARVVGWNEEQLKLVLGVDTLRNATLRGWNLQGAKLRNVDLTGADLSDANLWDADLHEANLSNTKLNGACLRGAGLQNAVFTGADLEGAQFRFSSLQGADLQGARNLAAWQCVFAWIDEETKLPGTVTIEEIKAANRREGPSASSWTDTAAATMAIG
jgi:Pentapeptide repeats (8 copies)